MSKYVLLGFSDGDARVYPKDEANRQMELSISDLIRTRLAEGDDKRVLIEMAVLARGVLGRKMVDMTPEARGTLEGGPR